MFDLKDITITRFNKLISVIMFDLKDITAESTTSDSWYNNQVKPAMLVL